MLDAALKQFGLSGTPAKMIRHNENLTWCVDERYLLRIHRSAPGIDTRLLSSGLDPLQLRQQELDFLRYLSCAGMAVQKPLQDINGNWITILPDGTPATLLTWLQGHTPGPEEARTEMYEAAGAMLAQLHQLSAAYPAIPCRRYDAAMCRQLDAAIADCSLSDKHRSILLETSRVIADALSQAEDCFLLLHGDMSSGNMIVTEQGLVPIDFSLLGYGHPMFDLAILLASSPPPGQEEVYPAAVIRGYIENKGCMNPRLLDICYALSILSCITLHLASWPQENWFEGAMERWEKQYFSPVRNLIPIFPKEVYSGRCAAYDKE